MRRDRGIALVVVLWVSMLLAGVAGAFVLETRSDLLISRNVLDRAEARAIADGGVDLGVFEALRPAADRLWATDGTVYSVPFGDGQLEVAIEDETGKIDLNAATDVLLKGILQVVGVAPEDSSALADAIMDWRDPDDLKRLEGAEDDDYQARGREHGARDAPFPVVADLEGVLGITPELYRRLAPFLTVYSGVRGVRLESAPAEVLRAIPGVTAEDAEAFVLARRDGDPAAALAEFRSIGEVARHRARGSRRVFTIRARGVTANGGRFVREAVVQLVRGGPQPYVVREWREGDSETFDRRIASITQDGEEAVR